MKKILFLALPLALAACSVPTTGAVPRGEGMYTVTRQGATFLTTPTELKAAAMKEAEASCTTMGKKYKFLHSKETAAGAGVYPESEVLYRCD